jgi:tRNA(Ile)-lysidine synthase
VWREDQSNATSKYARNYFRNEIMPSIQKVIPAIQDNLIENISRFNEVDEIYKIGLSNLTKKLITQKGDDLFLPVLKLQKMPALSTVLYEVLSNYHFTSQQIPEVVKLINSESGKYIASSTHRLLKNRQWMILSPLKSKESNVILIEQEDGEILFSNGVIKIKNTEDASKINTDKSFAMLDASDIKFPLLLRRFKKGDYFYPLGMEKKKKLSRFFIDNKLSLDEKENTWVIESDKKIIWIVGHRIDNRFKITPKTKSVISFQLISSK